MSRSPGSLLPWYFGLLTTASVAWAVVGIVTDRIGFIVFGGILATVFAGTGYVNTKRSIARRDYEKIRRLLGRRR
jgi:uncharacterized membrane protein